MSAVSSSSTPSGSVKGVSLGQENASTSSLEKEKAKHIAHLIRLYGFSSLLNVDECAAYVVEKLASSLPLAAAVQRLLVEKPSDPVAHVITTLSQRVETDSDTSSMDNDCTVWNITPQGLPEPLPLPTSTPTVKGSHPRRWTASAEAQKNAPKWHQNEHSATNEATTVTRQVDQEGTVKPSAWDNGGLGENTLSIDLDVPTVAVCGVQPVPVRVSAPVAIEDAEKLLLPVITASSGLNEASKKKYFDEELKHKVIDGRFEIVRSLGVGGLGAVFQCSDLFMPRQVAVKVDLQLNSNKSDHQKKAIERDFLREGAIVALLDSPCIMKIFHFGRTPNKMLYQIMEFIPGKTVKDFLTVHHHMDKIRTVSVVGAVLEGLHHAHQKGVVHKDLKPANILLLDGDRGAKIIDWGTAQCRFGGPGEVSDDAEKAARNEQQADLETSVAAVGTPKYMSIEQLEKLLNQDVQLDGRSDLYAVALIAYECITGRVLREQYSGFQAWQKAVKEFFEPLHAIDAEQLAQARQENFSTQLDLLKKWQFAKNNSLDEAFYMFLRQSLQPDPKDRFLRAKEMLWALEHMDESAELPQSIQDAFENVKNGRDRHAILDLSAQPPMTAGAVLRLLSYMIDYQHIQRLIFAKEQTFSYELLTSETRLQLEQLFHQPRHLWIENLFHLDLIREVIEKSDFLLAHQMVYLSHRAETNQDMVAILLCVMSLESTSSNINAERDALQTYLLAQGADRRDDDGFTAFRHAWSAGNVRAMNALLDVGADIHAVDSEGSTPLLLACAAKTENLDVLSLMLERGAQLDINLGNNEGRLPLHAALKREKEASIALLLKHGANFTGDSVAADEAFKLLSEGGAEFVSFLVQDLLEAGVTDDINRRKKKRNNMSVLDIAVNKGHKDVVRWLLLQGAKLDALTRTRKSALFIACDHEVENLEAVSFLLELGATRHIHIRSKDGSLPLHCALKRKHKDVVALLLNHGANFTGAPVAAHESSPLLNDGGANDLAMLAQDLIHCGVVDDINALNGHVPLFVAASWGLPHVMRWLLDDGADINLRGKDGVTLLHTAARVEPLLTVSLLLDNGADINIRDKDGCTTLHMAAMNAGADVVSLLLDNGADIHALTDKGESVLFLACQRPWQYIDGSDAVVSVLLERGGMTDIHKRANNQRLPLHEALLKRNKSMVVLLLKHGANFTGAAVAGHENFALLNDGVAEALAMLAQDLISCGVVDDINAVDEKGLGLLHKVVGRAPPDMNVLQWIMDNGADINIRGKDGCTPLHMAAVTAVADVVSLLLDNGADIHALTDKGESVLFLACQRKAKNEIEAMVSVLLERGGTADIHKRTNNQRLPLHEALLKGNKSLVILLLKHGANFTGDAVAGHEASGLLPLMVLADDLTEAYVGRDQTLERGNNPYRDIAGESLPHVMRWLVDDGADINLRGEDGWTPLHMAAVTAGADVVSLLLDNGADIHALTDKGESVLYVVCKMLKRQEAVAMVSLLLERGGTIDINKQTNNQRLPLHEALLKRNQSLVILLLKHGANFAGDAVAGHEISPLLGDGGAEALAMLAQDLTSCGVVDDINAVDKKGLGLLHKAVNRRHVDVVKWLLDNGADVNLLTAESDGLKNSLDLACVNPGDFDSSLVDLLLSRGAAVAVGESGTVQEVLAQMGRLPRMPVPEERPWWKLWGNSA